MIPLQGPRSDLYKVPEVEAFMVKILEKKERIEPVFDLQLGYRYPDVENAVNMTAEDTIAFLDELHRVEILDRDTYDMELRCPKCDGPRVSTTYVCPHCDSAIIRKTILLEHYACGFLGTATSFGEPLVCPKCEKRVPEGAYRNAGSIYECASCKNQIETPFVNHWCSACDHKFSFDNAIYQPKYAYFPAKLTRKEIEHGILYLYQVEALFKEHGFARDTDPTILGASGAEHVFDAAFQGFETKLFIDIMFALDPIREIDLLKEYGKIKDVMADVYVLVLPKLDDKAAVLAESYAIHVIAAAEPTEVLSKLRTVLEEKVIELKAAMVLQDELVQEPEPQRSLFEGLTRRFRRSTEK